MDISLENMIKRVLAFPKGKISNLYVLLRFLDKVLCVLVIWGCKNIYSGNFVQEFPCWSVRQPNQNYFGVIQPKGFHKASCINGVIIEQEYVAVVKSMFI